MDESSDLPLDALRRLARGLLYDRDRADDVVQEAWLATLRHSPAPAHPAAWLAGAVRRIARSTDRDELRRARRERRAARPEALPSTADTSARIEILRALIDAVDALDEPYRAAIVLRYFDELPPRTIARRLGVPVNTARTHVRRGLERLRRQLDGERGERREWLAALVPFVRGPGSLAPASLTTIGALLVKKSVVIAVALVLLAGFLWFRGRSAHEPATSLAGAPAELVASAAPEAPAAASELPAETANAREAVGAAENALRTWVVRGHVTRGGSSTAYPSAPLRARMHAGFGIKGPVLREERVVADPSGDFEWALTPPEENVTVWVEPDLADHALDASWETVVHGAPPPQLLLVSAVPLDAWVSGRVVTPAGAPVAGATVDAYPRSATTDAAGAFELRVASLWGASLSAGAPGWGQVSLEVEDLAPGERRTVEIVLANELHLRGRVVDEAGAPIAAVKITATDRIERVASTDADGHFDIGGWPLGESWVDARFEKEGYAPFYFGRKPESSPLDVEIVLTRGRRIAGRVFDANLRLLEGAEVGVGYAYSAWVLGGYTDAEGRFAFEHVPADFIRVEGWHRRLGACAVELDDPTAPPADEIELVLDPGHFLGGRVLGPGGAPVRWTRVSAVREYISHGVRGRADLGAQVTDAEGRFRFEGLPADEIELSAFVGGFASIEQRTRALDRDDLVLALEQPASLAGRVVDGASGAPVAAFTVRTVQGRNGNRAPPAEGGEAFTTTDGVWRVTDDVSGGLTFLVEVSAPGYAPGYGRVVSAIDPDPERCLVRLTRGARVVGHVVERGTQHPVAGALVRRRSLLDRVGYGQTSIETRTDAQGAFELVGVPPGDMTLHVASDGGTAVDGPLVVAGEETIERWIELGANGRIFGRLLDADGNGIGGARVTAYGAEVVDDERNWNATTAPDGGYELTGLPAGVFQVQWARELEGIAANDLLRRVELAGGAELALDLQPQGNATVRGTLTVLGELPRVVSVFMNPQRKPPQSWADGARCAFAVDGRFEIAHLEAGKWTISAHATLADGTAVSGAAVLDVPAEGTLETTLALAARP